MLKLFLFVLMAHMLGDYVLQTDYMAMNKGKDNYLLFVHSVMYNLGILVVSTFFGITLTVGFYALNIILHYLIDWFKASGMSEEVTGNAKASLFVDQLLHYAILIVATLFSLK